MNIETFNLYQEMTQLSIVNPKDDHETFEPLNLESFFDDLEIESLKRNPKWSYMFEEGEDE